MVEGVDGGEEEDADGDDARTVLYAAGEGASCGRRGWRQRNIKGSREGV